MCANQKMDKISALKKTAAEGDVTAQFRLSDMYEHGKGVKRNLRLAKNYYEMAANQGDSEAQLALAFLYSRDKGFERNFPKAKVWFEKAANQGDAIAQINLAELYETGKGVERDYHKAFALYKNVAEKNNVFGYIPLAKMYWEGLGTEKDPERAEYWLEKILPEMIIPRDINRIFHHAHEPNLWGNDTHIANWFYEEAKAGNAQAINSLVDLIEKEVVMIDEKLITTLEKADTIANPTVLHTLGNAFLLGKKVQKDYAKAEKLLLEAATRGVTDAYFDLANLYKNCLHDYEKALQYLYKSVENGDMDAYIQLGDMYQDGLGVEKDWSKAKYYYDQAKNEEFLIPFSEYFIGKLYETGEESLPKNIDKAIEHYIEASKYAYKPADDKLKELGVPLPELNYQGYLATKHLMGD